MALGDGCTLTTSVVRHGGVSVLELGPSDTTAAPGSWTAPSSMAVAPDGRIVVADASSRSIQGSNEQLNFRE